MALEIATRRLLGEKGAGVDEGGSGTHKVYGSEPIHCTHKNFSKFNEDTTYNYIFSRNFKSNSNMVRNLGSDQRQEKDKAQIKKIGAPKKSNIFLHEILPPHPTSICTSIFKSL